MVWFDAQFFRQLLACQSGSRNVDQPMPLSRQGLGRRTHLSGCQIQLQDLVQFFLAGVEHSSYADEIVHADGVSFIAADQFGALLGKEIC